jgi:hypothetical protein
MASTDQIKFCPKCGASRVDDAWICPCGFEFGAGLERSGRRRHHRRAVYETEPEEAGRRVHRSRGKRRGPLFATIWFFLLSLHWVALMVLVFYLRGNSMNLADKFVASIGCLLAFFYLWVAFAVFRRRRYIWDIAMVCAGIWLFLMPIGSVIVMFSVNAIPPLLLIMTPTGAILALLIFSSLLSSKSDFIH